MKENPFELKEPEIPGITQAMVVEKLKSTFKLPELTIKLKDSESIDKMKALVHKDKFQVIHGNIPSKSNCYKIITFKSKDPSKSHASLAKTKALTQYEKDFYIQCSKYRNAAIDEYFTLEVDVYYPSQRSDLDNCLKVLLDCLQKVNAITNDNKCVRIVANKFLDAKNPRIEFVIKKAM